MDAPLTRPLAAALVLLAGCTSVAADGPAVARPQAPVVPLAGAPAPTAPPAPVVPASAAAADPPPAGTTRVRAVAVIGTDTVVTDDQVWTLVRQRAREYARLTGADRQAKEKEVFRDCLRALIEQEIVLADFLAKVKKNKPQALDEIAAQARKVVAGNVRTFRRQNNLATHADYQRAVESMGLTVGALEREMERQAMLGMYMGQFSRDVRKEVTLGDVEAYYRSHPDEFRADDAVKWRHLFVAYNRFATPADARTYADRLLAQLAAGADFADLAAKYGHGTSQLNRGDGLGEKRGDISPPELEPTVFRLSPGQTSDPVPTPTGLHIVRVVERQVAGVRPFDEKVQAAIRAKLTEELHKKKYDKLIDDLWRKTTVQVLDLP